VGSDLEVVIDRFEAAESIFVCSRPGAVVKAAWENLEVGQTVEGKVVGVNKGGLEVEVAGHRAFMPASQVSLERIPDLSVMIGEKVTCQVAQLDKRGKGNIVLSRRDLLAAERKDKAAKLKGSLNEGDTLDGTVRKIMPFGAFVDIGGVDGLVHISDLSYDRVGFGEQAIGKHLKEGQQVKVRVLKVEWNDEDPKKSRISLGVKQLAADPFQTAVNDIKEGAEVGGRITRLADFGAFVELAPGVEGLVHVSEIAWKRIGHPKDVLKENEVVRCKVLKLDPGSRKISLSIKAMTEAPAPPAGRGGKDRMPARSIDEITKETPALRRLRAQAALRAKNQQLKGGF
jgi:small subunit ribosomal protein S1